MGKLNAVTTLLVLGLVSGAASAQHEHDRHGHRGHHGHNDHHGADRRDFRGEHDHRGHDYRRGFRRGDRLPHAYRSHQYVVEDWWRHRLSPPPRGHRWMQIGPQYMLVAVPAGIVLNVVFRP